MAQLNLLRLKMLLPLNKQNKLLLQHKQLLPMKLLLLLLSKQKKVVSTKN